MATTACVLCTQPGGTTIWEDGFARVVLVGDADHPGFCRVILNAHETEMTNLSDVDAMRFMRLVFGVERSLRALLTPEKINLASLGNMVPHLHWHVIPRFADDPHFPNTVWSSRGRDSVRALPADFTAMLRRSLNETLVKR
jgi:diadenosine tetraphosphate (Ap4A) HIT family hydrolase